MDKLFSLLYTVALMAGMWKTFQKMGRNGWEGIIPFYNLYVLCEVLYNNGNKFWFLLIPGYNIYVLIKYCIDLAKRFHKSAGFGVGLALLAPVFFCILGFGKDVYMDGSLAVEGTDPISQALNKVEAAAQGNGAQPQVDPNLAQLEKLNELYKAGIITEEEFTAKKKQLLGL